MQFFFQAAVLSMLLYGCTAWTLTKRIEKKLDGNYKRMLRAILNKSWRQHPKKQQLYVHLPPTAKTIQVRRTRHAGHCWRSKDELISDILLWTPSHGRAKTRRLARTYIQQLCADTGCSLKTYRKQWTIGKGERVSGWSALAVRHDDDRRYEGIFKKDCSHCNDEKKKLSPAEHENISILFCENNQVRYIMNKLLKY